LPPARGGNVVGGAVGESGGGDTKGRPTVGIVGERYWAL